MGSQFGGHDSGACEREVILQAAPMNAKRSHQINSTIQLPNFLIQPLPFEAHSLVELHGHSDWQFSYRLTEAHFKKAFVFSWTGDTEEDDKGIH